MAAGSRPLPTVARRVHPPLDRAYNGLLQQGGGTMRHTRREFLASTTAATVAALGTKLAASTVQGANDRIRVGIIGTGGRARGLMNQLKDLQGVAITAVCDVYEPRLLQAAKIAPEAQRVADYRRILDDRDI